MGGDTSCLGNLFTMLATKDDFEAVKHESSVEVEPPMLPECLASDLRVPKTIDQAMKSLNIRYCGSML